VSRTDKTNPHWVKAARREKGTSENHRHHGPYFSGACQLEVDLPQSRWHKALPPSNCHLSTWYYGWSGDLIYGRHPKGKSRKLDGKDGRARAKLRQLKHKWSTVDVDDIDSFEAAPYQRWLWAKWYWD